MKSIAIFLTAALFGSTANSFEFVVDQFAIDAGDNAPGDGICDAALLDPGSGGQCTLRAAIMETNLLPGADTILIPLRDPAGIPQLEGLGLPVSEPIILDLQGDDDFAALGDLDIRDDLTISVAPQELIIAPSTLFDQILPVIDASALNDRIFQIFQAVGDVDINGLILQGGNPGVTSRGGAVRIEQGVTGEVTLQAVEIASSRAFSGSAVYTQSPLSIINSRMRNNRVRFGLVVASQTHVTIGLSSMYNNPMSLVGLPIVLAEAPGFVPANIRILSSSILGHDGAAVAVQGNALAQLQNVTVSGNRTAIRMTGEIGAPSPPSLIMSHTVLANSSMENCVFEGATILSVDDYNLDDGNTCDEVAVGATNLSDVPAGLADIQSDSRSWHWVATPQEGSSLIDSGSKTTVAFSEVGCVAADQRLATRPRYGVENPDESEAARCDIGAIEFLPEDLFANGFEP